jgi:hypothetical protein
MSNPMYDERAANAPMAREAQQYPPGQQYGGPDPYTYGPGPGYGYPAPWQMRRGMGMGMRHHHSIETKPFYLTSEFVISFLASIAIAISAATMHAFGGWRAWMLITAIIVSYNLSRGIAKSGSRSRAYDPREELQLGRGMVHDDGHREMSEHDTRVGA